MMVVNIYPYSLEMICPLLGLSCKAFILFLVLVDILGSRITILAKASPVSTLIASKNYDLGLTSLSNFFCS